MDGLAIRPAMLEIGVRLASQGYVALLPDLLYRSGPCDPMDPHRVFSGPEQRRNLIEQFLAFATPANIMADTSALLDYLAAQPDVQPGGIGTTGYCMGGLFSPTAAGTFPDRIVATASYHGGRLATEAPESPHRIAPHIRSRVYIAGAIEDPSFPGHMKDRLEDALTTAGVDHTIETCQAKHGRVFHDTPVYDAAACERHWQTLIALLDATLQHPRAVCDRARRIGMRGRGRRARIRQSAVVNDRERSGGSCYVSARARLSYVTAIVGTVRRPGKHAFRRCAFLRVGTMFHPSRPRPQTGHGIEA